MYISEFDVSEPVIWALVDIVNIKHVIRAFYLSNFFFFFHENWRNWWYLNPRAIELPRYSIFFKKQMKVTVMDFNVFTLLCACIKQINAKSSAQKEKGANSTKTSHILLISGLFSFHNQMCRTKIPRHFSQIHDNSEAN